MIFKGKGPVQHLDRNLKARMIEAFLIESLSLEIKGLKILDVGCGNGQISKYFAQSNDVYGVDVEYKLSTEPSDFNFEIIDNEILPFENNLFDVVISHHVIEHVNDQSTHLTEILRVLKSSSGIAYLGCPNKGSPFMAGHVGNELVPTWIDILELFKQVNIQWEEFYTRLLTEPDKYHCELTLGKYVPEAIIRHFKRWYPSHCFILRQTAS